MLGLGSMLVAISTTVGGSAPTITSIDLDLGDTAGGELRTLAGTGYTAAGAVSAVSVGGTPAIAWSAISDTELIVVMPAHAAATGQSILVTTPGGTNAANALYEYWSPAELALTGFADRGNYQDTTMGTWPGRASAGTSGGRNFVQASAAAQPTEVGMEPDLDGVNDNLVGPTPISSLVTASAGTIIVLAVADTVVAASAGYNEATIFADLGAYLAMTMTASGFGAMLYDATSRKLIYSAASVGALHLGMMRWDGVTLGITTDGSAEVTTPCGPLQNLTYGSVIGANYGFGAFLDGRVRTLLVLDTTLSYADYAKVLKWARACRGLPQ